MRFTLVLLLAFTVTPMTSFAYGNKTVIEVYQEAIQKLDLEYEKLKQLTAEAKQKVADLEKDANSIKTLIAKYEKALETTTQALEKKHEAELKVVKDAYRTELAAEAKLAELARHSAEDNDKATRALLDKLGTSAEKVAKLTNAVSVSSEGKVGMGTTSPRAKLDVNGSIVATNNLILSLFSTPQIKEFSFSGKQDFEVTLP
jgi:Skp family chaperone for outer membrane proteins